ncbi:MAG: hypothetical protein ACXVSU_24980 [Solirubrobacteraceae bacterium]
MADGDLYDVQLVAILELDDLLRPAPHRRRDSPQKDLVRQIHAGSIEVPGCRPGTPWDTAVMKMVAR